MYPTAYEPHPTTSKNLIVSNLRSMTMSGRLSALIASWFSGWQGSARSITASGRVAWMGDPNAEQHYWGPKSGKILPVLLCRLRINGRSRHSNVVCSFFDGVWGGWSCIIGVRLSSRLNLLIISSSRVLVLSFAPQQLCKTSSTW